MAVTNANVAVPNGGAVTSNFSLALPGVITGKVRGLPDSTALRGALVQMRRGAANTAVLDSARTDSLGNYTFNGLAAATNYRITATAAGFLTASNANVVVTAGGPTTSNLTLAVGARSLITGKVVRAADSLTVFKNALVVLRRGADTGAVVDSARTDSLGNYGFSNLIPGTPNYWVKVPAVPGFVASTRPDVALLGNDTVRVDFFLAVVVSIRPAASIAEGMRVDRLGDRIVIHVDAANLDRVLTVRDIRGVQWYRATVPAGATQVTLPAAKAPQGGALIRLE